MVASYPCIRSAPWLLACCTAGNMTALPHTANGDGMVRLRENNIPLRLASYSRSCRAALGDSVDPSKALQQLVPDCKGPFCCCRAALGNSIDTSKALRQLVPGHKAPSHCCRAALGNNVDTSKALRRLMRDGVLLRSGKGGRREPYAYQARSCGTATASMQCATTERNAAGFLSAAKAKLAVLAPPGS